MCTLHCILLDHNHIRNQHIPSFVYSIRLVLQDYEHVRCILPDHAHLEINTSLPFIKHQYCDMIQGLHQKLQTIACVGSAGFVLCIARLMHRVMSRP
jgi:hypothetical protein